MYVETFPEVDDVVMVGLAFMPATPSISCYWSALEGAVIAMRRVMENKHSIEIIASLNPRVLS